MNESEKHQPENFWKKAFDDASEMPPPRVWDSIERRLDKSEEGIITGPKIVPLWDSGLVSLNRIAWSVGIAASLALLLIGWWSLSAKPAQEPVAQRRSISQPHSQAMGLPPSLPTQTPAVAINKPAVHPAERIATASRRSSIATPQQGRFDELIAISTPTEKDQVATQTMTSSAIKLPAADSPRSAEVMSASDQFMYSAQPAPAETHSGMSGAATVAFTVTETSVDNGSQNQSQPTATMEQLAGMPVRTRNLEPIQRIVWVSPVDMTKDEKTQSAKLQREVWASVSVMPGSFNPAVSLRSVQAVSNTAALNSSTGSSQSSVNSRAGLSITYQAVAGVQVTPRWSVEGGVGYLSGQSSVESPAQRSVYNNQTASITNRAESTGNLYVNALRNSLPITYKSSFADIAGYQLPVNYDPQSQQSLANNYQFVQVPVQMGYQLRPRKRFGLAVLGGLLTNIFVRNTVGDNVVITSKDGVYRPLSWSATLGARFRYRPSRRWSASLAGLYQTAFGSGTEATSQVQNRLSATGMSFGVDYHF